MTFEQYLKTNLYPKDLSEADRKSAYESYRKWYKSEHQKLLRKRNHRMELMMTKSEFKLLDKAASKNGKSVSAYTKNAALAYLNNMYVLPDDEIVQNLEMGIKRIGNNVNQLVIYAHKQKGIDPTVIPGIHAQLQQLEKLLSNKLRNPSNLTYLLELAVKEHPNYARVIQRIIHPYL